MSEMGADRPITREELSEVEDTAGMAFIATETLRADVQLVGEALEIVAWLVTDLVEVTEGSEADQKLDRLSWIGNYLRLS